MKQTTDKETLIETERSIIARKSLSGQIQEICAVLRQIQEDIYYADSDDKDKRKYYLHTIQQDLQMILTVLGDTASIEQEAQGR